MNLPYNPARLAQAGSAMKLSGIQIYELQAALAGLHAPGKQGEPQAPRLKFPGPTIYAFARNLRKATEVASILDDTKAKLAAQFGLDKNPSDSVAQRSFEVEWLKVLRERHEIDLVKVKVAELNLDENDISINIVASIDPFLEP